MIESLLLSLAPPPNAHRMAVEICVYDRIEDQRGEAVVDDVDEQLAFARDAIEHCSGEIDEWAANSPAVLEAGNPIEDVRRAMTIHYAARGALFAGRETVPMHLKPADDAPKKEVPLLVAPPEPMPRSHKTGEAG